MVAVFVHGIFSSCEVFSPLKGAIEDRCPSVDAMLDFSYPFLEPLLTNAARLNNFLDTKMPPGAEVTIIAHSMGGLVSRLAMLTGSDRRPYRVHFLVMLATPNHGAIKMNQINGIADMIRRAVGKFPPIDHRSRGLDDLTRVNSIMNDLLAGDLEAVARTKEIDYITIPALRYNSDHPYDERPPKKLTARLLNFLASMSAQKGPVELTLPHDGVVEEPSVRMVSIEALDQNERTFYSTDAGKEALARNANVHVIHPDLRSANHIEVHSIERVCRLVPSLLNSNGIDSWIAGLDPGERTVLHLSNGELV